MADFVTVKHPNKQDDPQFEDVTYEVPEDALDDWLEQGWEKVDATSDTAPEANVAPIKTSAPAKDAPSA